MVEGVERRHEEVPGRHPLASLSGSTPPRKRNRGGY
jgi:hypothetical protein